MPNIQRVLEGQDLRTAWNSRQTHVGLHRGPPSFSSIAGSACGNDVFPGVATTLALWLDVIAGQLARWQFKAAVLALMTVP